MHMVPRRGFAVMKDVRIKLRIVEFAQSMVPKGPFAVMKDVEIK